MPNNYDYKYTSRICNIIAFPWQKWLREGGSLLRHKYIAFLVKIKVTFAYYLLLATVNDTAALQTCFLQLSWIAGD
jgi:hypothetical protein